MRASIYQSENVNYKCDNFQNKKKSLSKECVQGKKLSEIA